MVALFESDPAFVGSTLAGMTSGASLFEFLLTPSLGALSDRVGRRKVSAKSYVLLIYILDFRIKKDCICSEYE